VNSGFRVVSSSISNKRCGTAIFIKDNYKVTQVSRDDEGRFVQAIVGDKLSFVSLYAPNKNPERNTFFSSISEMIDLTRPTFVCDDFNSVLDSNLDRKRRASFVGSSSAAHQESGPALQSLLSATQTFPVWCTFHPSQESFAAISGMACGKTPGSDGFPMEFYLCFWQALGADLVRILNVAYESGQLSTSQCKGLDHCPL
jgi:exonuclease III